MLLYFGPETYAPLASVLAAAAGVLLMFWNRVVGFFRRLFGRRPELRPPSDPGGRAPSGDPPGDRRRKGKKGR